MKRSLLYASLVALGASSAFAVSDGFTYPVKDGIAIKSQWIAASGALDPNGVVNQSALAAWNKLPFAGSNNARTACIARIPEGGAMVDKILVTWHDLNDEGTAAVAHLSVINLYSGELEKDMLLTLDGQPTNVQLCANQVGCDDFGHVWVCGYKSTPYNVEKGEASPYNVYQIDMATGAMTLAFTCELPADEKEATGRTDYYSLVGDVTRAEAGCAFMTCTCADTQSPYIYGWMCAQGESEFGPLMEEGSFVSIKPEETYPADQAAWGTASCVRIVKDEDFSAAMFYVDGFTTCPSLYDNAGGMMDSFASATELAPKVGTNGVGEFTINDKNFIFYSLEQYDSGATCRARICELGEDMAFEGMEEFWTIPEGGLGVTSDGGARYHACETRVYTDANGVEGAYVLSYKGRNGMAVYTVAPEEWVNDHDAAVGTIAADTDVNAPVEYFNLNGQAVNSNDLVPGLYITRQGSKTAKVVVK